MPKRKTKRRRRRRRRKTRKKVGSGAWKSWECTCYQQKGDTCCFYSLRTAVEILMGQKFNPLLKECKEPEKFKDFAWCDPNKKDSGAENLDSTIPLFQDYFPNISSKIEFTRIPAEQIGRGTRRKKVASQLFPTYKNITDALAEKGTILVMLIQNYDNSGVEIVKATPEEGQRKMALFNGHCITCMKHQVVDGSDCLVFLDTNKEKVLPAFAKILGHTEKASWRKKPTKKVTTCIKLLPTKFLQSELAIFEAAQKEVDPAPANALRQNLHIQEMWKLKRIG